MRVLSSLTVAALTLAAATSVSATFSSTQLYAAYTDPDARCYRQPVLVTLPPRPGKHPILLLFAEGRNGIAWCSGTFWPDKIDFPLFVRRSEDGGNTWGPRIQLIRGDIDFYTAAVAETGDIVVHVQVGDSGIVAVTSRDEGRQWSPPANVTISNLASFGFASVIPGVGHGLTVAGAACGDGSCNSTAGRMIMPYVCTLNGPVVNDTGCIWCRTCLLVSDDNARSWQIEAVSPTNGSREAALVQLPSAVGAALYVNERNLGATPGYRLFSRSTDGGVSFGQAGAAPSLPDVLTANWTGVVSGLARAPFADGTTSLVFTAPTNGRAALTAFVSADGGNTWAARGVLWAGPAAYSDVISWNDTHVAVAFECGVNEFAGGVNFGFLPVGGV